MLFKDETAIDPLKVLSNEVDFGPLLIPFNTSVLECKMTFDAKLTAVMGCDGDWKPLDVDYVQQAFSYETEWSRKSIELKVCYSNYTKGLWVRPKIPLESFWCFKHVFTSDWYISRHEF